MRNFVIITGVAALGLLLLSGVAYSASEIPAIRDARDSTERARVQALIDGARKENVLEWTGSMVEPKHSDYITGGFKEYYGLPQLKLSYTYGAAPEIISKVEQVIKAGRNPPDIIWLPAWDWYHDLLKRGKLMRYASPYYKEYTLSHKAGLSVEGYWVSDAYSNNPMWNVKELEKRGIKNFNPTSWWDFVDPKLTPLTSLSNVVTSTANAIWAIGMRKTVGDEWFVRLAKGKPAVYTRAEQGETWVTSGEYPICLMMRPKHAQDFEGSGGTVGWLYPKEGQVLFPFTPVILENVAHPNTAKLFIDYVRSLPGTNRMAESGITIIYGRPGVKILEKARKYLPPPEEMKVIPMDWQKEITVESVKELRAWAKKIGIGY